MRLSYIGAPFLGWQVQPQGPTVQGCLEQALSQLLRKPTAVTGAGRTDAGVNARMMVAHFDADDSGIDPTTPDFAYRLNAMAGRDISIEAIWRVADDAHARFDAIERTYRYYAATRKTPFLRHLVWQAPPQLDFDAMNAACAHLLGRQDFTSFSKLHTQVKTNICDIRKAIWAPDEGDRGIWHFEISADRFLRNMVRAIVGTLVEVGRGKAHPDSVRDIISMRNRCSAGTSMPGHALYLWDIKY